MLVLALRRNKLSANKCQVLGLEFLNAQMVVEKLLFHIRNQGMAATARKALAVVWHRLTQHIYRSHVEILLDRDLRLPAQKSDANTLLVRELGPQDIDAVRECIRNHNVHPEYGAARLAYNINHGYRAAIGILDGKVIAYGWLVGQAQTHPSQRLHDILLRPNELFACDLFVAPKFRRNNMALEFMIRAQETGRELGIQRIVTSILESNRRSLRVHHQAGYREIGRHKVHTFFNYLMLCGRRVVIHDELWF